MPSLQEFLSYLDSYNDLARADRFDVRIQIPQALTSGYGTASRDLSFQCETAELPGRTISTFDARTYGPHIRYPYETTYSPLVLTFICTGNSGDSAENGLWEKSFFDDWLELISPTDQTTDIGKFNFEYKSEYAVSIDVNHYDTNGDLTYSVTAIDAFPISVNQLSLNWSDESLLRLTVEFMYTRWERNTALFTPQTSTTNDNINTAQNPNLPGPFEG